MAVIALIITGDSTLAMIIAAEKEDVQSQVNAANAYYLGQGTTENHAKAHEWWLKADQRGHLQRY